MPTDPAHAGGERADTTTAIAVTGPTGPDTGAAADAGSGPVAARRAERRWWLGVAALTAAVGVTWAPRLGLPLADNHPGRVDSRYALHLRNLQQDGLLGSTFGADWEPYVTTPYAHHPPLRNMLDALVGSLPGDGLYQVRVAPLLLALLAIPAAAALLRGFGIRWVPTMLAVGLMVATGFFWIYAPLRYDLGLILALSAAFVHMRQHPRPPRWLVAVTCLLALMGGLQSWPSIAFAVAFAVWLLVARRWDRTAVAVGVSTLVGVLTSLTYIFGIHGFGRMAEQAELRTGGTGFDASAFVSRLAQYLTDLTPPWYLALLPFAVAAGLADRRTRAFTALAAVYAACWSLVLNNGSYTHDYWSFLILVPGLVGAGALLDRVAGWLAGRAGPAARAARLAPVAAGLGLAAVVAGMAYGKTAEEYLYRPTDATRLVIEHPPPGAEGGPVVPGEPQQYAWHDRFLPPRWLAYYWNLPPRVATPEELAGHAGPDDYVIVNLDRPAEWFPAPLPEPVAQRGRYALIRAADLQPPG